MMADAEPWTESPARHASGSSTNPNTPRALTPEECEHKGQTVDGVDQVSNPITPSPKTPSSSSKSAASGDGDHDIKPTWPTAIDETKIPVLVKWGDEALSNLLLDLHWHPSSSRAFFKLRTWISCPSNGRRRDGRTSIYVFIYPERVRRLSIDPNPPDKILGTETMTLKFDLIRPPALVLPKTPCEPRSRAGTDAMSATRALVAQTSFVIYANIPHRRLAVSRIQDLCAAASGHGLMSLAVHANPSSLYQGQGGQIVEGDGLVASIPESPAIDEPPPRYSEPAEPPSASRGSDKGKKRLRRSSSSPGPAEPISRKVMQDMLDAGFTALKHHFDDRLAVHKQEVVELLGKSEARILDTLRKEMDQRCDGMQEVLDDRVHKEMAEVQDNVMRNISEAPLQATLTFPQHPWY